MKTGLILLFSLFYVSNVLTMFSDQQFVDLYEAIKEDDVESLEKIIGDSDINQKLDEESGLTPLIHALYSGANKVALFLINNKKAIVNYMVGNIVTPLGIALCTENVSTDVIKSLINNGARVDNIMISEDKVALPALVYMFFPAPEETKKFLFAHLMKLYDKQLLEVALVQCSQMKDDMSKYFIINSLIQRGAYIDPKLPEFAKELNYDSKSIGFLEFYLEIRQQVHNAIPEMPDVLVGLITDYAQNVEVSEFYFIDLQNSIIKFKKKLADSFNKAKERCVIS